MKEYLLKQIDSIVIEMEHTTEDNTTAIYFILDILKQIVKEME